MIKDQIQYGTTIIDYELEFSERKTLGIKVHPDKTVEVNAPSDSNIDVIKARVKQKASWILKQQEFFLSFDPITPPRKFVSGETHLYLGKQYRLKIIESENESVKMKDGYILIQVALNNDTPRIEFLLKKWYKEKASLHFNKLFKETVPYSKGFYNGTPVLKYRWMKKRWGSCDVNGQIHLNLELIKAPKSCIEYVIVHELCHLAHLNHSKAFFELMEKIYPNWKETKNKLEKLMV
ncbi:M48 family metallopeptidase [Flavobacteriaceae bacterium GSB9]|nr:M48 family metallopeptidase [Flavobacteriaceae bacterium GSB9]